MSLFDTHRALLDGALAACASRAYWSPFPENASPKIYGETAQADGQAAVEALLGKDYPLQQPGEVGRLATERSPYGVEMGVRYPECSVDALIAAAQAAEPAWTALRAGRVDHLLRADEGGGEGLLDENGLAVRDGRERDVAVVGVRRRDVDDVDLRRLEQLPVRPVGVFHPVASGELLRLLLRPGRDRGQLGPGHELEVTGDPVRDRPQTDNSPANRAHASRLVGRG